MLLRIFTIIVAIGIVYLSYDIYRITSTRSAVDQVESSFAITPEDADLTVVEFLDYSCPHCRNIHPIIMEAVQRDGRVQYIPRPIPVIDEDSLSAALTAYTAGLQGKFIEMHQQLINNTAALNETTQTQLINAVGLDRKTFDASYDEKAVKAHIDKNISLFNALGGKGTPMFVIGRDMVYYPTEGMPSADDFLRMFNEAREK